MLRKGQLLKSSTYTKPKIKGSLLSNFTQKRSTFEEFYVNYLSKKRSTLVTFHNKKSPFLGNFALNQKIHFCQISRKNTSSFEEFYAKPKKGPLLSYFTLRKSSLLRTYTLNQKNGPLLSDFTLISVHIGGIYAKQRKKAHFSRI